MASWLLRLFDNLLPCRHVFVYEKTVDDWNFRAGYAHKSEAWKCSKCNAIQTIEKS